MMKRIGTKYSKKATALLLILTLAFGLSASFPITASAAVGTVFTQTYNGVPITYTVIQEDASGNRVEVGSEMYGIRQGGIPTSTTGLVTIPSSVVYGGKTYMVAGIGALAFLDCYYVTSFTLPSTLTYISYAAFAYCTSIQSISLPHSLTSIGNLWGSNSGYAFTGCSSLTTMSVPYTPPTLYGADNFPSNMTLNIPSYTVNLYLESAAWSTWVKNTYGITFIANNVNGVPIRYRVTTQDHINHTGTVQVGMGLEYSSTISSSFSGALVFPSTVVYDGYTYTVTKIAAYACFERYGINGLLIPQSVTHLGEYSFAFCTGLNGQYAYIPTGTNIDPLAFYGCSPTIVRY